MTNSHIEYNNEYDNNKKNDKKFEYDNEYDNNNKNDK